MKVDVNIDAARSIKEYCSRREWNCKACRYSIDKVTKEHSRGATCIFENCPCDWRIEE